MQLTVCPDLDSLQETLAGFAVEGVSTALVPTMGALHEGHRVLIRQAKELADAVVVSIFVNPKQFGKNEDLSKYPRPLEADLEALREEGVQVVYTPQEEDLYPEGFATSISAGAIGQILCGASRPGHFDGVATVVNKLIMRIMPHVIVFGEKDFQQLCVIQRMVTDLDLPVDVASVETVREDDGLALSSRNQYLSKQERRIAPDLYATLQTAAKNLLEGTPAPAALEAATASLKEAGFEPEYLVMRDAWTLSPITEFKAPARLLVAARLGATRLIDNIIVE